MANLRGVHHSMDRSLHNVVPRIRAQKGVTKAIAQGNVLKLLQLWA